jgi:hypothetical protein
MYVRLSIIDMKNLIILDIKFYYTKYKDLDCNIEN